MKAARLWPLALGAVLALTVIANVWLLWAARDDQYLAFEPDYYRKAVAWDSTAAQRDRSAALGWRAAGRLDAAGRLTVTLADAEGAPIRGAVVTAEVIPVAHASRFATVGLSAAGEAGYATSVPLVYRGLHEIRVTATRGADRFTATLRGPVGGELRP